MYLSERDRIRLKIYYYKEKIAKIKQEIEKQSAAELKYESYKRDLEFILKKLESPK